MPILLDTPHTHDPGHGAAVEVYTMAMLSGLFAKPILRTATYEISYVRMNGSTLEVSPERPRSFTFCNKDATSELGVDPETGEAAIVNVPADPQFDEMKDGWMGADGVPVYDSTGIHIYQRLISDGHYEGSLI